MQVPLAPEIQQRRQRLGPDAALAHARRGVPGEREAAHSPTIHHTPSTIQGERTIRTSRGTETPIMVASCG